MGDSFYMRLYTKEFLADSKVRALSREHRADLVDLWCHGDQEGSIPSDPVALGRLLGLPTAVARRTLEALRVFFVEKDGRLFSPRQMRERLAREAESERKRDGANKTNAKRWGKPSLSESDSESLSDRVGDRLATGIPVAQMSPVSSQQSVRTSPSLRSGEVRAEAAEPPTPLLPGETCLLSLPCVGKGPTAWPVGQSQIDQWTAAFPGVPVLPELRKMKLWLEDPACPKPKTHRGMGKAVLTWLGNAQKWGSGPPTPPAPTSKTPEADETLLRQIQGRQWPKLQSLVSGDSR